MAQTTASASDWASRTFRILKRGLWAVTGRGRPRNPRLGQPDSRVNHRLKVHFEAAIYTESGWMRARGVNMHSEGALVIASQPLAPQSVVFVRLKSYRLMGFAQVRHCTRRGPWSYAIGVKCPVPLMKEQAGRWHFHQVRQTDDGWSEQWEASMKPGTSFRAL